MLSTISSQSSLDRLYPSSSKSVNNGLNKVQQSTPTSSSTTAGKVSISDDGYIKSLSERYDVENMSSKDMTSLAEDLYAHHLITPFEKSAMTIEIKTPGGTFDENAKHNFKAQWEYSLKFAVNDNNASNIKIHQDVVNILNRIENAKEGNL